MVWDSFKGNYKGSDQRKIWVLLGPPVWFGISLKEMIRVPMAENMGTVRF